MPIRKHRPGGLVIEQTRDVARVTAMLTAGGVIARGVEWPAACYLMAYAGDEAVGVIGIESKIDAALVKSLFVAEQHRRHGIGARLIAAARKAAHTRGARSLYLFAPPELGDYFRRFGFAEVASARLLESLAGVPEAEYYRACPDVLAREVAFHLDISEDGVIRR